jgi:Protein kinase domain
MAAMAMCLMHTDKFQQSQQLSQGADDHVSSPAQPSNVVQVLRERIIELSRGRAGSTIAGSDCDRLLSAAGCPCQLLWHADAGVDKAHFCEPCRQAAFDPRLVDKLDATTQEAMRLSAAYHASMSIAETPCDRFQPLPQSLDDDNQARPSGQALVEFVEMRDSTGGQPRQVALKSAHDAPSIETLTSVRNASLAGEHIQVHLSAQAEQFRKHQFVGMCLQHLAHLICGSGVCPVLAVSRDAGHLRVGMPRYKRVLESYLPAGMAAPEGLLLRLLQKLSGTLAQLHAHGIAHLDVKPMNILVSEEDAPVLCDFGSAAVFESSSADKAPQDRVWTAVWAAPELLKEQKACPASDVYSLGLVIASRGIGENPPQDWPGKSGKQGYPRTVKAKSRALVQSEAEHSWPGLVDRMLSEVPTGRPTMLEVFSSTTKLLQTLEEKCPSREVAHAEVWNVEQSLSDVE